MDTLTFLSTVLAQDTPGFRCVATPAPNGGYIQRFFADDSAAARRAELWAGQGKNVYFACAIYRDEGDRTAKNALACRSLWADLDVGEGKPYATQHEALAALVAFNKTLSLPSPLVVNSGNGIHAYWPFDRDVEAGRWREIAISMRGAMTKFGLGFDRSRATDLSSVLRPPGTMNVKDARSPKPVTVLRPGKFADPDQLQALCDAYSGQQSVGASQVPAALRGMVQNDALSGGMTYAPADAEIIANHCAQVAALRDVEQGLPQPAWFHAMQVVQHCTDGVDICHEWSSRDSRYTEADTDRVLDRLKATKPTTCQTFHDKVDPAVCLQCPFWGKIKSPIALGYEDRTAQAPAPTGSPSGPAAAVSQTSPSATVINFPNGYRQGVNTYSKLPVLEVEVRGKEDGKTEWKTFSDTLFYPVQRIATPDGFQILVRMFPERDDVREFTIPAEVVAQGGVELAKALGRWEITTRPFMRPHMDAYMTSWINKLRQEVDSTRSYQSFGWDSAGNFVVGRAIYTPTGVEDCVLTGIAHTRGDALQSKGDLDTWVNLVDRAYNAPGQEAFQFMVLCGFASALFPLYTEFGGVTVFAHSAGTARGKTTAQRCALSIWGNWQDMQINQGMATNNAFFGLAGAYQNLPMMFDELTNIDPDEASRYAFAVSQGRQRERMDSAGNIRTNNANWSLILLASGNRLLTEIMKSHRANADAEVARVFEFSVDCTPHLTPEQANALFPQFQEHYGVAGATFADYIVRNRTKVQQLVLKCRDTMMALVGTTQQERYWAALTGSVLAALKLTVKLGLVQFDQTGLVKWMTALYEQNREGRADNDEDTKDMLGRMLNEMWPAVLVTEGEGTPAAPARIIMRPMRAPLAGRCIIPPASRLGVSGPVNVRKVLYISHIEARTWAIKHNVDVTEIFEQAVRDGIAAPNHKRVRLGKGTEEFADITGMVRCWELDLQRMGSTGVIPLAQKVALVANSTP